MKVMSTQAATTEEKLFYPTGQKEAILENLARHEVLTLDLLIRLLYPDLTDPREMDIRKASLRRTLRNLELNGYISSIQFTPDDYVGLGTCPKAYWLLEKGAAWCRERFPATDPKHHGLKRSGQNIRHDLARSETRMAIFDMCMRLERELGWRKNNLFHFVKPDDFFEITRTKTTQFFLEEERSKKHYKELFEKCEPYVKHFGSGEFKNVWGFRHFTVIIPMRDKESRESMLIHFAGGCDCIDPYHRQLHRNGRYKLKSDVLWFTTHELITTNPEGKIFLTPTDYEQSTHSILDIVN